MELEDGDEHSENAALWHKNETEFERTTNEAEPTYVDTRKSGYPFLRKSCTR